MVLSRPSNCAESNPRHESVSAARRILNRRHHTPAIVRVGFASDRYCRRHVPTSGPIRSTAGLGHDTPASTTASAAAATITVHTAYGWAAHGRPEDAARHAWYERCQWLPAQPLHATAIPPATAYAATTTTTTTLWRPLPSPAHTATDAATTDATGLQCRARGTSHGAVAQRVQRPISLHFGRQPATSEGTNVRFRRQGPETYHASALCTPAHPRYARERGRCG